MLDEYLEGMLFLSAIISLSLSIVHPRLRNVTSFAAGILTTCALLLPLVDIIRDIDINSVMQEYEIDIEYDKSDEVIEQSFEDGIATYISEKYATDKDLVSVRADGFDMGSVRAQRIYVTLSGRAAMLDYKKIEEDVCRQFTNGGECEVSIKIG